MSAATCKTCPWHTEGERRWDSDTRYLLCRVSAPVEGPAGPFPRMTRYDWCGEHPDRQRIEYAEGTLLTHDDDGPSAADMRRIVDALEKIATRAAVKP